MFEGVAIMSLRTGEITCYRGVANTAPALVDISFAPERIASIVGKHGAGLKARPQAFASFGGLKANTKSALVVARRLQRYWEALLPDHLWDVSAIHLAMDRQDL